MVKYYYIGADNESHGPIDPSQFTTHGLTADSMVCPVGGQEWVRLADIPGLADYIGTTGNRKPCATTGTAVYAADTGTIFTHGVGYTYHDILLSSVRHSRHSLCF